MVSVKRKITTLINVLLLIILIAINIALGIKKGLDGECCFIISLAIFCFSLYAAGQMFPNKVVYLIHKLSETIYKKSSIIEVPVIEEAKRTFKKRLIYLLIIVNVLLLLLILTLAIK